MIRFFRNSTSLFSLWSNPGLIDYGFEILGHLGCYRFGCCWNQVFHELRLVRLMYPQNHKPIATNPHIIFPPSVFHTTSACRTSCHFIHEKIAVLIAGPCGTRRLAWPDSRSPTSIRLRHRLNVFSQRPRPTVPLQVQ